MIFQMKLVSFYSYNYFFPSPGHKMNYKNLNLNTLIVSLKYYYLDLGCCGNTLITYTSVRPQKPFSLFAMEERNSRVWKKLIEEDGGASHLPQALQLCHQIQPAQSRQDSR